MNVVCLSGGVGGARLACGLYDVLAADELTVVGNVGDDLEVLGLAVSPDLDSILYALAGLNDTERGWGRAGETWNALASATAWGGESWFQLGDLDIGLHLVRTRALRAGSALSAVTADIVVRAGLRLSLLPATDSPLRTHVVTTAGRFSFQEWFVGRRHADPVDAVEFEGAADTLPAPGVLEALRGAELIIVAPSNPYVSVGPILAVPGLREAIAARHSPCVAVSPLIGGEAVKGPAAGMLQRLAGGTTPAHVAGCYEGLIDRLVIDHADAASRSPALPLTITGTLMTDRGAARRLAETILQEAS
ncbi:MAG: 2-phospho-L-lactate transferase [Gaiella sp.]